MIITNIVYPVEPGFVWLLNQDGLWSGWRDGPFMVENGRLVEVTAIASQEMIYRVFFCHLPVRLKSERWKPLICLPEAEHFDLWSLPLSQMHEFERKYLPMIIRIGMDNTTEPLLRMG